jgi:hypothetical protein
VTIHISVDPVAQDQVKERCFAIFQGASDDGQPILEYRRSNRHIAWHI